MYTDSVHKWRYYSPITPSICNPQNYTTPNPNKNCTDASVPPQQPCNFSVNTNGPDPPQNCDYVVARLFVGTGDVSGPRGENGAIKDYDIMSSPESWRSSGQTGGIFMRYNHATSIGENVVEYDTHNEKTGNEYKIIDPLDNSVFFEPSDSIYKSLLNTINNPNNPWLTLVQSESNGQPEMNTRFESYQSNKTLFEKHRIKILLLIILLLAFIVYKYTSVSNYNKLSFGKNYNPVEALMNA
jgi:hypothetical protein